MVHVDFDIQGNKFPFLSEQRICLFVCFVVFFCVFFCFFCCCCFFKRTLHFGEHAYTFSEFAYQRAILSILML